MSFLAVVIVCVALSFLNGGGIFFAILIFIGWLIVQARNINVNNGHMSGIDRQRFDAKLYEIQKKREEYKLDSYGVTLSQFMARQTGVYDLYHDLPAPECESLKHFTDLSRYVMIRNYLYETYYNSEVVFREMERIENDFLPWNKDGQEPWFGKTKHQEQAIKNLTERMYIAEKEKTDNLRKELGLCKED